MGNIGWINTENYSFDCMLRMERFQIRLMLEYLNEETEGAMAAALKANPKAAWLFAHKCPEMAERVKTMALQAPDNLTPEQVRAAETFAGMLKEALEAAFTNIRVILMETRGLDSFYAERHGLIVGF